MSVVRGTGETITKKIISPVSFQFHGIIRPLPIAFIIMRMRMKVPHNFSAVSGLEA